MTILREIYALDQSIAVIQAELFENYRIYVQRGGKLSANQKEIMGKLKSEYDQFCKEYDQPEQGDKTNG
jgi:hypothetical protein